MLRELGRGGMGVVYLARQPSLDRLVALKVLPASASGDQGLGVRFAREARAAALMHPHIVPVIDYGDWEGGSYIAMGYVAGGTLLQAIVAQGRLDPLEVGDIGAQVAMALGHAHAQGVVHRDVKPSNILLDGAGNAFLTDFGIALVQEATRLTAAKGWVGTPAYMAPELVTGGRATAASDVYSLGATLFEALTGEPPFRGDEPYAVLYQHRFEPVPDLPMDVPAGIGLVVLRALDKDPAQRFATAADLARALRNGPNVPAGVVSVPDDPAGAGPPSPIPRTVIARVDSASQSAKVARSSTLSEPLTLRRRWPRLLALLAGSLVVIIAGAALAISQLGDRGAPANGAEGVSPPRDLVVERSEPLALRISWAYEDSRVASFVVQIDGEDVARVDRSLRTYQAAGLLPRTPHCVVVFALSDQGARAPSNEVCRVPLSDLHPASSPTLTVVSSTRVRLTWTDLSVGEAGYRVLEGSDVVRQVGEDRTSVTVGGLSPGRHCFTLVTFSGSHSVSTDPSCVTISVDGSAPAPSGNPGGSAPSVSPTASPPPSTAAPTPTVTASGSGSQVTVSWSAPGADEVCFTADSSPGISPSCQPPRGSKILTVDPGTRNRWCALSKLAGAANSEVACAHYDAPATPAVPAGAVTTSGGRSEAWLRRDP